MKEIRAADFRKQLGEVLRTADLEPVVVWNRDQPRTVVMSAGEFVRLKRAAGEPVPPEATNTRPALHQPPADPLGYDTRDPNYQLQMAQHALRGDHRAEIEEEVDRAMRRWGMQPQ